MTEAVEHNPQDDVVEALDCPVIVQAGAGSGKTRTLTERIVHALDGREHEPYVKSIENVVAITFTKKAAEELKGRIRERLEQEGNHEQALKVDDAYISTIHGFASRILRENALAFEIDPAFDVLDDARDSDSVDLALEEGILNLFSGREIFENMINSGNFIDATGKFSNGQLTDDGVDENGFQKVPLQNDFMSGLESLIKGEITDQLADFVQTQTSNFYSSYFIDSFCKDGKFSRKTLLEDVNKIIEKISLIPNFDMESFFFGEPLTVLQIMTAAEKAIANALANISFGENKTDDKAKAALLNCLASVQAFIEKDFGPLPTLAQVFEGIDVFLGIYKFTPKFHAKEPDRDAVLDYNLQIANLATEYLCLIDQDNWRVLVSVALAVNKAAERIKMPCMLTNNDLQRVCFEKLLAHPDIAQKYRNKFDLIMVDEFQDTDNLQLSLISLIAKEGMRNVCTVGDIQQSIYRFRGADVNVFRYYKNSMVEGNTGVKVIDLPNNYRSHKDILKFTDVLFSGDDMFGDEFLHLEPKGKVNSEPDKLFDGGVRPRVKVHINNYINSGTNPDKILTAAAVEYQATIAAKHLRELYDAGAKPGTMAVLLASLSSSSQYPGSVDKGLVYQKALSKVGLESIITGGSGFAKSDEVEIVTCLLSLARNIFDSDALLRVLKFDFMNLSNDALLALSTSFEKDKKSPTHALSKGFMNADPEVLTRLSESDVKAYTFALDAIANYIDNVRYGSIEFAIRAFLSQCGVFDELDKRGADGLVSAGNFEKAFSFIRNIEEEYPTVSFVYDRFVALMEHAKERPAILSTAESDFVEIMTVHASKGLQFDHVVCAELDNGKCENEKFYIENSSDGAFETRVLLSGASSYGAFEMKNYWNTPGYDTQDVRVSDEITAGELFIYLLQKQKKENLDEAKRKLYVAITRAKKSVLLLAKFATKPENGYENQGIWNAVHKALKWENADARYVNMMDADGSKFEITYELLTPRVFDRDCPTSDDDESVEESKQMVQRPIRHYPEARPKIHEYSDFVSYSSLAKFDFKERAYIAKATEPIEFTDDNLGNENVFWGIDEDRATDFGSELHSAMELMVNTNHYEVPALASGRLAASINKIFGYKEMFYDGQAEVPFCVNIDDVYLRGAFDLIKAEGSTAIVVDYKSGTAPKDHELQAQVYAYALLNSGFNKVKIDFLHSEVDLVQSFEFDDAAKLKDIISDLISAAKAEREEEARKNAAKPVGPKWAR